MPLIKPLLKKSLGKKPPGKKATSGTTKTAKALTPLEKARLARAANKGSKKPVKKPAFIYPPPSDFKPYFMDVKFKTDKDGLLGPQVLVERVRGRWDNENAKRWDMSQYDQPTVSAFLARLGGVMFAPSPAKRLPGGTAFRVIVRVSVRKKEGVKPTLNGRIVQIARYEQSAKTGKLRAKWLEDSKDLDRRRLRRASRHLGGAFTKTLLPPSTRRSKKEEEAED